MILREIRMSKQNNLGQFTQDEINDWYENNPIDLSWLIVPSRHQFRWRQLDGRWISNSRKISKFSQLSKQFHRRAPTDLYYGVSEWLEPVGLPRIRETDKLAPVLLDHFVVFDIDQTPFSYRSIEKARKITVKLVEWLKQETELNLFYVCYSGSKGFHVVLKDNQRDKFVISDHRKREATVRESRKKLLDRVISAGFPVDKTVTGDTRRIIRLPGSLHGKTGWVCTKLDFETLNLPCKKWINQINRHPKSIKMPYFKFNFKFPVKKKIIKTPNKKVIEEKDSIFMEVSSHVNGTSNRSALVTWLPNSWGGKRKKRFFSQINQIGWSPCYHWTCGERDLLVVPLAIPRDNMMRNLKLLGLIEPLSQFERLGHCWTQISPKRWEDGEIEPDFQYEGIIPFNGEQVRMPYSNPHLDLINKLGVDIEMDNPFEAEFSGKSSSNIRISKYG